MHLRKRKLVVWALLAGFLALPALRAFPDEGTMERRPAASSDSSDATAKPKKKKKKKTKKGKAKKHAAKAPKHARSHKRNSGGSSTAGGGSHYPTQPGGSGFADIPNEKKDDLPPPASSPKD